MSDPFAGGAQSANHVQVDNLKAIVGAQANYFPIFRCFESVGSLFIPDIFGKHQCS